MDARHDELLFAQFLGQLSHSFLAVGEDHALGDGHVLVELDESGEFLTVFLHRDVELLDTVQSELFVLDEDLDGLLHELLGHLEDFGRHGG